MNNPQVIKICEFLFPNDPPDYVAEVYERHPERGDVFLYICAIRNTRILTEQAAIDHMKIREVFGTTFLQIEG